MESGPRLLQSSSSQLTDGHCDLRFGAWGKVVTGVPVQVQTRIQLTSRRVLEEAFIAGQLALPHDFTPSRGQESTQ